MADTVDTSARTSVPACGRPPAARRRPSLSGAFPSVAHKLTPATTVPRTHLSRSTSRTTRHTRRRYETAKRGAPARAIPRTVPPSVFPSRLIPSHGRREACGHAIPSRRLPRPRPAGAPAPFHAAPQPPRCRARPARGVGRQSRPSGRGRRSGADGGFRAQGEEGVGAADVPGGGGDVQPRDHLHGRRRRLLPLRLANGGRRDSGDGDVGHLRTISRRGGRDGVLGAVGAPGAVARLAVAHARVAPPPTRRRLRAQRRLRHRQRRPRHGPPRLRLLQPRPCPRTLLRRGARDHALRDGVHVRPRRPGPPPLPRGAHRERAILPAGRRRPPDPSHGQVRQRSVRAVPRPQGAGGGGRDRGAGEGDPEEDQEERNARRHATVRS